MSTILDRERTRCPQELGPGGVKQVRSL